MIRWCVGNQRLDGGCGPQRRPSPLAAAFDELVGRIAAGSVRWSRGGTPELWCWGCWLTCHARTAGRSPSTPAPPVRTGREHLLARAVWDADALRDDVRDCVTSHLGDPETVLVIDQTGNLKGHRHRRQDRQQPGRGLPGVCHQGRAGADRPGAVCAPRLDRRP
jgi:hypothetical protein